MIYTKQQIETLSAQEKRAALAGLLKSKLNEPRSYPLSLAQEGMWFQQQLEPKSPAYNLPLIFCIKGEIQAEMLQQCLDIIIRRHDVLRTVFRQEAGKPAQYPQPWHPVHLPVRDLDYTEGRDWKAEVLRLSFDQSREPIDLAAGPVFRIELVRVSETLHAMLMCIHHIVMDGWSIGVLLREFSETYLSLAAGKGSPLPALTVQYSDFVQWQRKRLQAATIGSQVDYWKARLQDAPPSLDLPADFPRPVVQTYQGATHSFALPSKLTDRLKAVSRASGSTLFMTMLASFYVLLARLSGQDDIVLGASVANRQRKEYSDLIGLFANTAPMRANLSGDPTFLEFLGRVRVDALTDYAHTDIPLARLVEELKPTRDPGRNVLFQAGFDFQNWPWPVIVGDGVTLLDSNSGAAKLDLNLSLSVSSAGIGGQFEYSTDLFTENTIDRITTCFKQLLESITEHPETRVSELAILSSSGRRLVVHDWNQTFRAYPADSCIHELFEQQARNTPATCALVHGEVQWSYRELNTRANRLARRLSELGVGAESRVGLCAERSPELIAGLLAVLKAGGCYVPLDPLLPPERLAYCMEDSAVSVVLTTRATAALLPQTDAHIICLDSDEPLDESEEWHASPTAVTPGNLAYLIYTSGSTGRPKGVMVTHSSLVNYACAAGAEFALAPGDRVLQFASLSFDASAEEIFPCLLHGATLVLRTDEMLSSPAAFLEACAERQISLLDLPTAYWRELVTAVASDGIRLPSALRLVIIGGEAASPDTVASWRKHAPPHVRLLNTYGPTEATIVATSSELSSSVVSSESVQRVSIGRPISNVQAYVVDGWLQPVPPGVYGELLLGGEGVARGYLNRPELTAEKFLPDPFSLRPGARLYRTGDICRHLANGELEFKGRVDGQVKLRGFRIELGELESTLQSHPSVNHAIVLLREGRAGDRRLMAFVVCRGDRPAAVAELRDWMRQRLPDYMIPAGFVLLEAFPTTVGGKVDRQALLALSPETETSREAGPCLPRDSIETEMLDIWQRLLDNTSLGIRDNFFAVGGHSLLAIRLQAEVKRAFGVDFPLSALFEGATIERLSEVVRHSISRAVDADTGAPIFGSGEQLILPNDPLVPIRSGGALSPLFLVHPIGGGILCYGELARHLGADQPVYGLQASNQFSGHRSVQSIAREYVAAIRSLQEIGPYFLGGWSMGGVLAYEMAQQLGDQGQKVALLVLIDSFLFTPHEDVIDEVDLLFSFVEDLTASAGKQMPDLSRDDIPSAIDDCVRLSLSWLKSAHVLPQGIALHRFYEMWRVYRSNYEALIRYEPRQYANKITLLEAASNDGAQPTPFEVWQPLAPAGIDCSILPGDHYTLLTHPAAAITGSTIQQCLNTAHAHFRSERQERHPQSTLQY